MQMDAVASYLDNLTAQLQLPYFEVLVSKGYDTVFHYTLKQETEKHKDRLFMYSCTKPLTVTCAMRLVQEGKLTLSDRLVDFIPAFMDTYYQGADGCCQIAGSDIQIYHLLTMSAGLNYNSNTPAIRALCDTVAEPTARQVAEAIAKTPLEFLPGERFKYSYCHDVLGAVIEEVTGMPLSLYMDQIIFLPLGMHDSSFQYMDTENHLKLYTSSTEGLKEVPFREGETLRFNPVIRKIPSYDSGGAGLVSTVADYAKFACVLANGGRSVDGYEMLAPEILELIRREHISGLEVKNNFTCVQGGDYSYGLGVRTRARETPWGLRKGEFGWDGAAGSYLMVDPNTNISIVMGMHVLGWPSFFTGKHLGIVEQIYRAM